MCEGEANRYIEIWLDREGTTQKQSIRKLNNSIYCSKKDWPVRPQTASRTGPAPSPRCRPDEV